MKIRKMMTSMTLAASMIMAQIPLSDFLVIAESNVTIPSRDVIANTIFGVRDGKFTNVVRYVTGQGSSSSTTSNHEDLVLVDPRITGTVEISQPTNEDGSSYYPTYDEVFQYTYGASWPVSTKHCPLVAQQAFVSQSSVSILNGYGVCRSYISSWNTRPVQYIVTYTPSAADIKKQSCFIATLCDREFFQNC